MASDYKSHPASWAPSTASTDDATSNSSMIDVLQTRLNGLSESLLHLSKPETHKATNDLLQYLGRLKPTLDISPEQHQTLVILTSAVSGERMGHEAKAVDLALKLTSCKEHVALFQQEDGLQTENRRGKSGTGGWQGAYHERLVEEPDMVAGIDANGSEVKWLRLL